MPTSTVEDYLKQIYQAQQAGPGSLVPTGQVAAYSTVATQTGQPSAARAVGNACAKNPIGFIIPCHRVIRQAGQLGAYRWGLVRKQAMLGRESAQSAGI